MKFCIGRDVRACRDMSTLHSVLEKVSRRNLPYTDALCIGKLTELAYDQYEHNHSKLAPHNTTKCKHGPP